MLTFIIPVKSKEITNSWELLSKLLERTLRSTCRQTLPDFNVVVVCNQKPDIDFSHPSIHYLEVDFPAPKTVPQDQIDRIGYAQIHSLDIANKNADKARKILAGIHYAKKFSPTYVMVVDADDCVSCHLAAFLAQQPEQDGWVMRKGYMYREGSRFLYINIRRFNHVSGTSVIIKYELHSLLFENPDFYYSSFDELPNVNIAALPFPGAVYSMLNGENILMSRQTFNQMQGQIFGSIPSLIQKLFRYRVRLLNSSIAEEFGLYDVNQNSLKISGNSKALDSMTLDSKA
jgi:hypothetical protein